MDADEAVRLLEAMEEAAIDLIKDRYYTKERLLENLKDTLDQAEKDGDI